VFADQASIQKVLAWMAWNDPLTRTLVLNEGRELATLRDAARLFASRFDALKNTPTLEHAIELLTLAAKSGNPRDIEVATDQLARMLALWKLSP
jgi:hypothetical protein